MSTTSTQGVLACNITLPILGIIIVGLRFYVRSTQTIRLKFDDWAQIPALLLFLGMAITALYGVKHRTFGYPTPLRPPTEPAASLILCEKLWYIIQILQILALAIIKVAALAFYRRIFVASTSNSILNIIIWILQTIIVAWAIGFIGFYISACGSHISAAWSGYILFAKFCLRTEHFTQAFAISDFLLDTFVLVTPLPSIWLLHMNVTRKISITGVFMFALIGYGASIARLVNFVAITNNALSTALPDIQRSETQAVWFSSLETGCALIALNLPSIWPLLSQISIESILRSVRSLVSLNSNISHTKSYNEIRAETRKNQTSTQNDDIELVPVNSKIDFKTVTEGNWHGQVEPTTQSDRDMEEGIRVQRSVDVSASAL